MSAPSRRPSAKPTKCGPHVELAANDASKITRCSCGTIHVHLHAQGISLRVEAENLRHIANAIGAASRLVDISDSPTSTSGDAIN